MRFEIYRNGDLFKSFSFSLPNYKKTEAGFKARESYLNERGAQIWDLIRRHTHDPSEFKVYLIAESRMNRHSYVSDWTLKTLT